MTAAAKNYQLVTLELHSHYSELNPALQKQFEVLLTGVRKDLTEGKDLIDSVDQLIEAIFAIRVKAIKWLAKQNQLNLEENLKEVEQLSNELSTNERLETLSENLGFALRTIRRVTLGIVGQISLQEGLEQGINQIKELPELDYWSYFDLLSMTIPNEEMLDAIMEWVDSSLELEYGVLAALLIQDENLIVSDKTVNDLAELIAIATQDYSAYSVELGIMPMHISKKPTEYSISNEDAIKEQQLLADSGLEDLGNALDK